jgi:hypothetical protein
MTNYGKLSISCAFGTDSTFATVLQRVVFDDHLCTPTYFNHELMLAADSGTELAFAELPIITFQYAIIKNLGSWDVTANWYISAITSNNQIIGAGKTLVIPYAILGTVANRKITLTAASGKTVLCEVFVVAS